MLSERRQQLIVTVGCLACVAVIITLIAIGTEYWCAGKVILISNPEIEGQIHFGLFRTSVEYNFGLGGRDVEKSVYEELDGAFSLTWLMVIIAVSLISLICGCLALALSFANAWTIQAKTILSPRAVMIWNGLGVISSVIAVVIFSLLYYTELQYNVIGDNWKDVVTSEDVYLSYSFWTMCAPGVVYLINILLLLLSQWIATWDYVEPQEKGMGLERTGDFADAVLF